MNPRTTAVLFLVALITASCGGGGSDAPPQQAPSATDPQGDDPNASDNSSTQLDSNSERATYTVVVENYWSETDFPQGYPEDAHLSFFGGAVHNQAVSFWSLGEPPSPGIINMAETGHIDILLQEVAEAVTNGTADSGVDVRKHTLQPSGDTPGTLDFTVQVNKQYPLVTLTSMLGPSPDWFVGVDGMSLLEEGQWIASKEVNLPLYDGGSRSNMTPGYVAYDQATGVYLATTDPQNVAKLIFTRTE